MSAPYVNHGARWRCVLLYDTTCIACSFIVRREHLLFIIHKHRRGSNQTRDLIDSKQTFKNEVEAYKNKHGND